MAGALDISPQAGGLIDLVVTYDDALNATALVCTNRGTDPFLARIVGWAADGSEDPNRTYGKAFNPGSDSVAIPTTANRGIPIKTNTKGKLGGFNTYTG